MWESWEQAKIERLEDRVADLERKNQERSDRIFRWTMFAYMTAIIGLSIAAALVGASHPTH
jgi:hypothetical protein